MCWQVTGDKVKTCDFTGDLRVKNLTVEDVISQAISYDFTFSKNDSDE